MTDTIQKAINKIDQEAEKIGGEHAKIICQYIIDNYLIDEQNAQKIMEKTLNDCLTKITAKAKKQASNNMAIIKDDVVFGWVADFYGFTKNNADNKVIDLFDCL